MNAQSNSGNALIAYGGFIVVRAESAFSLTIFAFAVGVIVGHRIGYNDGVEDTEKKAKTTPAVCERYEVPRTTCTSWDFGGRDGQKRCKVWKRIL